MKIEPRRLLVFGGLGAVVIAASLAVVNQQAARDPAEVILTSSDPEEIATAVQEIVTSLDSASLSEIVAKVDSTPELQQHVESIRDGMLRRLSNSSAEDRVLIVEALVVVDDATVGDALMSALLTDTDPTVRSAAADAIPRLDRALPGVIQPLIDARSGSDSPDDRSLIEDTLREIGDPAIEAVAQMRGRPAWTLAFLVSVGDPMEWLAELASSQKLSDQQLAVENLRRLNELDEGAAAPLWKELADGLRRSVTANENRALQIADILLELDRVQPSLARPIQVAFVNALLPKLGNQLAGPIPDFTLTDALARLGKPAVDRLIPIARQRPGPFVSQAVINRADGARNALISMISINPDALGKLTDALNDRDYELIADLMQFYIQLGRPGSESILIQAQDLHGDSFTAISFLESGNRKLESAAHDWAARNGYTITGSLPGPGSWGAARRFPRP